MYYYVFSRGLFSVMKDEFRLDTPYFLIDEDELASNVGAFQSALSDEWGLSVLAYSVKTNSLPYIVSWMNDHGVMAEVVSDEEYELALLCGHSPGSIVFNGPIKGRECFKKALDGGSLINIDSKKDLAYLKEFGPSDVSRVGIRVNVDPDTFPARDVGYQEDGFRFGFSVETGEFGRAAELLEKLSGGRRFGLHMHVNSVTRAVAVYEAIAEKAAELIKEYGIDPSFIDIGGGFFGGVPGKPTQAQYVQAVRKKLEGVADPGRVMLIAEPGSAVIASCTELHTSVLDVKDTAKARIVTTDGSRIHIDPLWQKKGYLHSVVSAGKPFGRQVICGYTCMDHDRIMILEGEPELSEGDRIIYQKVGNYTVTFGGPFILTSPSVYVRKDGELKPVRQKLSVEEYKKMESER